MFKNRIDLIPRYNWDYGFKDFISGLFSIFKSANYNTKDFETVFGQKPILTCSGRTSLYVILKALNLPQGAQVGVPLYCCPVVFDAIKRADLTPKFIDINLDTYTISPEDLVKKRDSLAAVVVVHMFGHPADVDSILQAVGDRIPVIEDCAQSLFSKYRDRRTGLLTQASFFSFRSGKYISSGEGSVIFTNEPQLARNITQIIALLNKPTVLEELFHCISTYVKSTLYKRPWYGLLGYPIGHLLEDRVNLTAKTGFKLGYMKKSDFKIISQKIEIFVEKILQQRENAFYLLDNIELDKGFLPFERDGCFNNYSQFPIRFINKTQRSLVSNYLLKNGIDHSKYLQDVIDIARKNYNYESDCPNAELCSDTVLVIPNYYTLSRNDLDYIVNHFNKAVRLVKFK